jgi:hypothetical protein
MTIYESLAEATFPQLDDDEMEHREEMRQQAIACLYRWTE